MRAVLPALPAAVLAAAWGAACSRPKEPPPAPPELPVRRLELVPGARGVRYTLIVEGGDVAGAAKVIEARLARLLPEGTAKVAARGERVVVLLPTPDTELLERLSGVMTAGGALAVHEVALGAKAMGPLLDHAVSDERAVSRGVGVDSEGWMGPEGSSKVIDDRFLVATDRAALEEYVNLAAADAALRPADGIQLRAHAVGAAPVRWRTFALVTPPGLDSSAIRRTAVRQMPTGDLVVELSLDDAGRDAFAALTRRVVGRKLAIVVDGLISSAPIVMDEIKGGKLYLSVTPGRDGDALRTAEDLAVTLGAGALPGRVLIESTALAD